MIKKLKENETDFIRNCSKCGGSFTYNRSDYFSPYNANFVKCPYCGSHQYIWFHRTYKSTEEKQEDYKELIKQLEREKETLKQTVIDRKMEINRLKEEKDKAESDSTSKIVRLKSDIDKLEVAKNTLQDRIKDYQKNLTQVVQEKMELEGDIEKLMSTIDTLKKVLAKNELESPKEVVENLAETPKKKRSKKNEEKVED